MMMTAKRLQVFPSYRFSLQAFSTCYQFKGYRKIRLRLQVLAAVNVKIVFSIITAYKAKPPAVVI